MEETRKSKASKVLLIIGAIIIILAALAYLIFQIALFVDVATVQPDPDATIDPEGINKAAYVIITIVSTIIAVIAHLVGMVVTGIGLVLNKASGERSAKRTLLGGLQMVLPIIIYAIGIVSIFIIEHV